MRADATEIRGGRHARSVLLAVRDLPERDSQVITRTDTSVVGVRMVSTRATHVRHEFRWSAQRHE
jgi:hypothetical protein